MPCGPKGTLHDYVPLFFCTARQCSTRSAAATCRVVWKRIIYLCTTIEAIARAACSPTVGIMRLRVDSTAKWWNTAQEQYAGSVVRVHAMGSVQDGAMEKEVVASERAGAPDLSGTISTKVLHMIALTTCSTLRPSSGEHGQRVGSHARRTRISALMTRMGEVEPGRIARHWRGILGVRRAGHSLRHRQRCTDRAGVRRTS